MVSWGGHRANGEGGLRPSSNAELSIFGQSLELFSPGLPATSTLHPWPKHGSQRLPLGCHAWQRYDRTFWMDILRTLDADIISD